MAEGTCYGRTDLGLAADVTEEAERLRAFLPADARVFSSPLSRCRRLAEALHPAPVFDERLVEMDFGAWEGRLWSELPRAELDAWAADPLGFAPPGGEPVAMLLARARAFLAAIAGETADDVVAVTHAGMIKAFHGTLDEQPPARWMRLSFEFGSVTTVAVPP